MYTARRTRHHGVRAKALGGKSENKLRKTCLWSPCRAVARVQTTVMYFGGYTGVYDVISLLRIILAFIR